MNKVILVGRLTADPELRQTQSGVFTCHFTVAVDRKYADKNTGERQADFISCTAWRQTVEFLCRYFSKGKMILVEGNLRTGSYTDKNHSDVTHYTTDVFVDNVEFCGDKGSSNGNTAANSLPGPAPSTAQSIIQQAQNAGVEVGDLSEFEEILSDGSVPF